MKTKFQLGDVLKVKDTFGDYYKNQRAIFLTEDWSIILVGGEIYKYDGEALTPLSPNAWEVCDEESICPEKAD